MERGKEREVEMNLYEMIFDSQNQLKYYFSQLVSLCCISQRICGAPQGLVSGPILFNLYEDILYSKLNKIFQWLCLLIY